MDTKDKLIEKAKSFQDEFDKIHHESWNLSRHGIAIVMTEFVLSLEKQVEEQESKLKVILPTDEEIDRQSDKIDFGSYIEILQWKYGAKWFKSEIEKRFDLSI